MSKRTQPAALIIGALASGALASGALASGALASGAPVGGLPDDFLSGMPKDIESMKRDARILMAAFSKKRAASGPAMAAVPKARDPVALDDAAVRQAFAQSGGRAGNGRR